MSQKTLSCQKISPVATINPDFGADPKSDAKLLNFAYKSIDSNKKHIIHILTRRSQYQRRKIVEEYNQLYSECLIKKTEEELLGSLEACIVSLLYTGFDFYAFILSKGLNEIRTDGAALRFVLCTMTPMEISRVKDSYTKFFKRNLEDDICSHTSGLFKEILLGLCKSKRDPPSKQDMGVLDTDVNILLNISEKCSSELIQIFCERSYPYIINLISLLILDHGIKFSKHLKKYYNDDFGDTIIEICEYAANRTKYFAKQLYTGLHTVQIDILVRVVVSRCEIDLSVILYEYKKSYNKDFFDDFQKKFNKCCDNTKHLLKNLLNK